jgi:hypothetical protein
VRAKNPRIQGLYSVSWDCLSRRGIGSWRERGIRTPPQPIDDRFASSVIGGKKTGLARASGATGAVTLIQRFGSALNLNIHFHMLVLDGAYLVGTEPPMFRRMAPPGEA